MGDQVYRSRRVWGQAAHISLGFFCMTYSLSVFNSTPDNIASSLGWSTDSIYIPIANGLYTLGNFIGCILSAPISKEYGRRGLLMQSYSLIIIGSIITIIPFTVSFLIGRLIVGVCNGIFLSICPIYVNEITPDEMTGKIGTLVQTAANLGLIFGYGLAIPLPNDDLDNNIFNNFWILLFGLPAILGLYQLYYFTSVCKLDSPAWYLSHNRKEEAIKSLSYIYTDIGIPEGLARFDVQEQDTPNTQLIPKQPLSVSEVVFNKRYRKVLRMSIMLALIQQLSGVNVIILYSTSIFKNIGGSGLISKLLTFFMSIVCLISGLLAIPLLKIYGRKTLIIGGQVLLLIDLLLLGLFSGYLDLGIYASAVGIYLFYIFFNISLGSPLWAYLGETANDVSLGLGMAGNSLCLVFLSFGFPIVIDAIGISNSFFIFAGLVFIGEIYQCIELFETKGLTKPEIQKIMLLDN